jgi:type II secretory pathway pseudopilin PulG
MYLAGQDGGDRGYAMAALLVGLAVMLLLMSVALPVWRHEAQREKEAELVFRGQQYARAVGLYTRKMGGGNFPPTLDVLVQQRFLRKKYKDPMTAEGDFDLITGGAAPAGQTPQPGGRGTTGSALGQPPQNRPGGAVGSPGPVGILGVRSKSKEASIRVYNGGTHYNEWAFVFSNISSRPGGGPGVGGRPGGPGGRGVGGRGGGRGAAPEGGFGFPGGPGEGARQGRPIRRGGPG